MPAVLFLPCLLDGKDKYVRRVSILQEVGGQSRYNAKHLSCWIFSLLFQSSGAPVN